MTDPNPTPQRPGRGESDFGLGKKHPYLIYLGIVGGLFLFLLIMGFLAVTNDWIPSRGINP